MKRLVSTILVGLAVLILSQQVSAYPRPAPVSTRPEFTFRPDALRLYTAVDGRRYWYFIYDVANTTGQDRTWAPTMVLYSDRGEVLTDGRDVPPGIVEDVVAYVGDPLLESKTSVIGPLRQGEGNARRGLSIWPARRMDINELRLFVEGISPETATVEHPLSGAPVTLRKTLYRHYLVPGNPAARGDQSVDLHPDYLSEDHWVFR